MGRFNLNRGWRDDAKGGYRLFYFVRFSRVGSSCEGSNVGAKRHEHSKDAWEGLADSSFLPSCVYGYLPWRRFLVIPFEVAETYDMKMDSNESVMRQMLAEAGQAPYRSIATYEEACANPNGYAILQGDDGGTVYLTVPLYDVRCGEGGLRELLLEIDSIVWKDPSMAIVYYEECVVGQGIPGGMGGGLADSKLWVHPTLAEKRDLIGSFLAGKLPTILNLDGGLA
jgi:hypothetical protein